MLGYFCDASALGGDFPVKLDGLLDLAGVLLRDCRPWNCALRAATATAGESKAVHLIIDFGTVCTGALLLEMQGEVSQTPEMMPLELVNRYHLDAWNDAGEAVSLPGNRWFSSRTTWCQAPFLMPEPIAHTEYFRETVKKLLGSKQVTRERETEVRPELFLDWSWVRLGREADDVTQLMCAR